MEPDEPLLQGYLLLPPHGMLGQLKLQKSWQKKFCQIFKASKYGIQRIEIYDNQEEALTQPNNQRMITLENCVKIACHNVPNVFVLHTKPSIIHYFGCTSEAEMANWMSAIQSVAFKVDTISSVTVEEDNDLYCTSGEGVFTVKIAETEASKKCGLELFKNYTLIVGATDMKLMDNNKMLYTWPYQYIRKYGYRDGKFTFEAGRRCGSGEGAFCLEHKNQLEIYRCFVSNKTKMKQMLSGENSPTVEYNDAQFQAALSMEAGSRSPLPPSKNLIDLDIPSLTSSTKSLQSPTSQSSTKSLLSSTSQNSIKSLQSSTSPTEPIKPPLPAKPKPLKPPRRPVFTKFEKKSFEGDISDPSTSGQYRKLNSPTTPDSPQKNIVVSNDGKHSYDLVEVRNDAWKTHGMDNVPHTERVKQSKQMKTEKDELEDPRYETMSFPSISSPSSIKTNTSSIIHNIPSPNDPPDYDRLQHFGSIYKNKNKSGYRTPNSVMSQNSQLMSQSSIDSNPSFNNYDVVEDMSSVRLADDSHHGYGVIRKTSASSNNTMEPKHRIVNDTEYAIVSKPKRV